PVQSSAGEAANLMRKAENLPGLLRRRELTAKVIDNARGLFCHRRIAWSENAPAQIYRVFEAGTGVGSEQEGLSHHRKGHTPDSETRPLRAIRQKGTRIGERLRRGFEAVANASDDLEERRALQHTLFEQRLGKLDVAAVENFQLRLRS